jgi:Domain of unknown function (DUF4335)
MESNNLTTRTYTAPTCALIVSTKTEPRLNRQSAVPMDFILHLEDPDRSETDRIALHGQAQQLDRLQQVVNKYISELVAQFPLPGAKRIVAIDEPVPGVEARTAPIPEPAADTPSSASLNPHLDPRAARSGILKNLPGLQKDNTSAPPPASSSDDRSIIDKLLGRRPKPDPYATIIRPIGSGDGRAMPTAGHQSATNHPYLTGVSDESVGGEVRQRSLDHQLHLGNLATPASGETIVLSAIQLFDLATVLDEYAAEKLAISPPTPSTAFDRVSIPVNSEQPIDLEAVVSRSRLPNLPHMSSDPDASPTYYRTRRPRSSSWMSALPWVAGAAIAMVGGVFILDPNFKPFQDIASMMKSPSLGGAKKSTPVKPKGELAQTPTTDIATTTTTTTGTLPTPWQQQPVQPPQVTTPIDSSSNAAQTPSKIGVAPLPDAIATQPGQTIPNSFGTPTGTTQQSAASILSGNGVQSASGIAPNPLNATQTPAATTKSTTGTVKTTNPSSKAKTPAKTTTASAQLPTELTTPGKFSVSKQPMPIPPSNAPAIVANPPFKPVPFNAPTEVPNRIDPATRTPAPKKSAVQAAKSTPNAVLTPSSSSEPFTPVPRNPNLIDPNQPNSATPDLQNPPVVPNKPLQSNAGGIEPEVPLLQESRRYFQSKWKAGSDRPNSLQYVVQVGKSGVVRSVEPQGEAASAYLRETKFIKLGQKLVSPAAAGSSDQKIRVLLQPDGNVDTFIEP